MRPVRYAVPAAALLLALAACGDDEPTADPGPSPSTRPTESSSAPPKGPQ